MTYGSHKEYCRIHTKGNKGTKLEHYPSTSPSPSHEKNSWTPVAVLEAMAEQRKVMRHKIQNI